MVDAAHVEPTSLHIPEAGTGSLDDELLPDRGDPVPQEPTGDNLYDTAGKHGPMAPEAARLVGAWLQEAKDQAT